MNLQQLKYILAIEEHQSFSKAAEAKFISQPALSMMVKNLEGELDIKIFDRSKKPIIPTEMGKPILEQARAVLREVSKLHEINRAQKETLQGVLSVGIIPTLAPYLLPLFLKPFLKKYPFIHLKIYENTTEVIIEKLQKGQLDTGLLVTPLHHRDIKETPLFNERFFVYAHDILEKHFLLPEDIDAEELWLLEEGHCLRSQILNLCELRKKSNAQFEFEAGSIDTLIKMVDHQSGVTIVPELATLTMSKKQKKHLRPFAPPVPVREVSIATHRDFVKKSLIDALKDGVLENLPKLGAEGEVERVEIGKM
ncbi:MAG TPA: hydrogen peroxide-inducible genes activator [Bacteroidetes bacterium]|nr:hydrogen peroxide-inducible genes activator [Bacteroidota bacterium]